MGARLEELIKTYNKEAKSELVQKGAKEFGYERIPFTSPNMNYCTFGGLPMGKMIEFFGEDHGGKTTTAMDVVANYQAMQGHRDILWVDSENTFDVEWATKLGVEVDGIYLFCPEAQSAEEIFQFILEAIDTGDIGLVVLDSLGALVSAQALGKTVEEKTYGGISLSLTTFANKAEMLMKRHNCTFIGINQIREDMNSTWGGIRTPGGRAWKHFCTCRLQFSRGSFIDDKGNEVKRSTENPVGNVILVNMVKNKSCPPTRRVARYTINYKYGIDYIKDLVDMAVRFNIIQKSGAWFNVLDTSTGEIIGDAIQGIAKVYVKLEEDEELRAYVESEVNTKISDD